MPTGILAEDGGADVGVTTAALAYDDMVKLFFSVKPRYRRHAVWVMNDETAYYLRTLKDEGGNYIWNHTNDTILGKPVHICNDMPSIGAGDKPIAFGDFSYFWIIDRKPFAMRSLTEVLMPQQQVGYVGYETIDAKLIRPEAVCVMQMK